MNGVLLEPQKRDAQLEAAQAEMRGHQDQAADLSAAHEDLAHQVGHAAHSPFLQLGCMCIVSAWPQSNAVTHLVCPILTKMVDRLLGYAQRASTISLLAKAGTQTFCP